MSNDISLPAVPAIATSAVTERKARPGQGGGRRPQNGYAAMTNAERQARFKQAKRDEAARVQREEAEARERTAQERARQARLRSDVQRAAGRILDSLPRNSFRFTSTLANAGWTEADLPEAQRCLDEMIRALVRGDRHLP